MFRPMPLAVALLCLSTPVVAINKCVNEQGKIEYTDLACPKNVRQQEKIDPVQVPSEADMQRAEENRQRMNDEVEALDRRKTRETQAYEQKRAREKEEQLKQEALEVEKRKAAALEDLAKNPPQTPVLVPYPSVVRPAPRLPVIPQAVQSAPARPVRDAVHKSTPDSAQSAPRKDR